MSYYNPYEVLAFHSCDKEVGLRVLNGQDNLIMSDNTWDWLGNGIYFWEQNPLRAVEYANECAAGTQKNKTRIKTPFVLGATIRLGNCLNLLEPQSVVALNEAYQGLAALYNATGRKLPVNAGANRKLDCAVIKYVHETTRQKGHPPYDTVRCAFSEGEPVFPGSNFSTRLHIEICVINPAMIQGYFLPRPIKQFNQAL